METETNSRRLSFARQLAKGQAQEWLHIAAKKGQDLKAHWLIFVIYQEMLELELKILLRGFMTLTRLNVRPFCILE